MAFKNSFLPGWATAGFSRPAPTPASETSSQQLAKGDDKGGLRHTLKPQTPSMADRQMRDWRDAVEAALSPDRLNRQSLHELYRLALNDAHLLSQLRTARNQLVLSTFDITREGSPDEDAKEALETSWFDRYLSICVDTELWGYSVVEFQAKSRNEKGRFTDLYLVPRDHVKPERGIIVVNPGDEQGVAITEGAWSKYIVTIGEDIDLGLLKELSPLAIRKVFTNLDWSRRNEKFGMPFVIAKTASRQAAELDAKEAMLRNLGTHMYAILDDTDEIAFLEPKVNAAAHATYKDLIEQVDTAISQLVNGQSGTQDEQAYVGSAQVHERILNSYTKARMRRIQNHLNDVLLPFLNTHGYPFAGHASEFSELRASVMDLTEDEGDTQEGDADAAKPKAKPGK